MRKNKSRFNNRYRLLATVAGVIIVLVAVLEITNTTHIFHHQSIPPVIPTHGSSTTSSSNSSQSSLKSNSTPSSNSSAKNPLPSPSSGSTLITPFGDFVSNHNPGAPDQNGNPTPTSETSVCDTTPGATCYISFTNSNGQTTQLPTQTAGSDGSTSWDWDVSQDAHLTKGEWQITAVASLNGQTKSTNDPTKLTIQ